MSGDRQSVIDQLVADLSPVDVPRRLPALAAFWFLPLLGYAPYTSPYRDIWLVESWRQLLPPILWPAGVVVGRAGLHGPARYPTSSRRRCARRAGLSPTPMSTWRAC